MDAALQAAAPVPTTRRVCGTALAGASAEPGDLLVLDLGAPAPGAACEPPLALGAGARACPGRDHALALAEGVLAAVLATRGTR